MKGSGACILNAIPDVMMAFVGSCFVMQFILPLEVIFSKHVCLKNGKYLTKVGPRDLCYRLYGNGARRGSRHLPAELAFNKLPSYSVANNLNECRLQGIRC